MSFSDFKMNPYHFFDSKLLQEKSEEVVHYHWNDILANRKKQFSNYDFIVTDNEDILYSDFELAWAFNSEALSIALDKNHSNIYWINIHRGIHHTNVICKDEINIIHENLVPGTIKAITNFEFNANCIYTHLADNKSTEVFHHYLYFSHNSKSNCFFLQNCDLSKNKINQKHYLLKEHSSINTLALTKVQAKQLRDDFIEIEHLSCNTLSIANYFSMNAGKCVSQINSIIEQNFHHCETHQLIKHMLIADKAQSFSKPNLMIKNPDVIASHGNSIGTYNEEELFYLMQRGICLEKAKKIIQEGMINYALQAHPNFELIKEIFNA